MTSAISLFLLAASLSSAFGVFRVPVGGGVVLRGFSGVVLGLNMMAVR
jgi:hypothetical protein